MIEHNVKILSTRPLSPSLVEEAAALGIVLDRLSFIETTPLDSEELRGKIGDLFHTSLVAVFTSMNAVDAVAGDRRKAGETGIVPWKVFCIGSATRQHVLESFGAGLITGTADSAAALADQILLQKDIRQVVFFCGDQRRDELPEKLQQGGVAVQELVVYTTVRTPHRVEQPYEGIAFFSPSAVHSYFSNNTPPAATILFAIGQTTADAIRNYSGNTLLISDSPDKEALIRQAIGYFRAGTK